MAGKYEKMGSHMVSLSDIDSKIVLCQLQDSLDGMSYNQFMLQPMVQKNMT